MTFTFAPLSRAATVAVVLGLSLSACGDDDVASSDPPPSQSALESALLTIDDVPDDMSEDPEDAEESDSDDDLFEGTCAEDTETLADSIDDPDVEATTRFANVEGTSILEGSIGYYEDDGALRDDLNDYIEVVEGCPSVTTTNGEGVTFDLTISVEEIDIDGADTAMKMVVAGPLTTGDVSFDFTVTVEAILKDHIMSTVATTELNGTTLTDQTHDLATRQFDDVLALT